MKKKDVRLGNTYIAKVSGKITEVQIVAEHPIKGWLAVNLATGRQIWILTAGRLTEKGRSARYR